MIDISLSLMTGADIPIPECQLTVHQPTIKEIGMIGEKDFFIGAQTLCLNKNAYVKTDKQEILDQISNFQIFMMIMTEQETAHKRLCVEKVLNVLFPSYNISFLPRSILINYQDETFIIDEDNFHFLQKTLSSIFCLSNSGQESFNPKGSKAKEIAEKLMRARSRVAAQQENGVSASIFAKYISILAVGLSTASLQDLVNLTQYQVYDLVERYSLHTSWDLDVKTRLAGGKPDSKPDNWMKDLH